MILAINPNPALDRVAVVRYRQGASLKPERFSEWAGGSGVHSAYVARLLGADVRVVAFTGGHIGELFAQRCSEQSIPLDAVPIRGETRGTYSLIDVDAGNLCDIAEPGPEVDREEVDAFESRVRAMLPAASLVIVSGSVPPGCPVDLPARIAGAARELGVRCIADVAGSAAIGAVLAERPWLLKPSRDEMREYVGDAHAPVDRLADVARAWVRGGVEHVCLSLDVEGVLWVSRTGETRVVPPAVPRFNSIGSGDTLIGALAAAIDRGLDLTTALIEAVAAAAANQAYDAPGYCTPADVERLRSGVRVL